MRHGNQVEWALHCVTALAALPPEKKLSAQSLADLHEAPPKYLAKALQSLSRAKLVMSTAGPRGGYSLARPASTIRLIDVVDAIEGSGRLFRCQEIRRRGPCRKVPAKQFGPTCGLAAAMWRAEEAWRNELASITVAQAVSQFQRSASPVIVQTLGSWAERNVR